MTNEYEDPQFTKLSKETSDFHLKMVKEASKQNKNFPDFCIMTRKDMPGEAAICFVFEDRVFARFLEIGELMDLDCGGSVELYETFWRQRCKATGEKR